MSILDPYKSILFTPIFERDGMTFVVPLIRLLFDTPEKAMEKGREKASSIHAVCIDWAGVHRWSILTVPYKETGESILWDNGVYYNILEVNYG